VNNVLSFHGVGFPTLAPLDLVAAIRSSVEFARPIADQAGTALIFEADDLGLWVQGNSHALQQVVLNMVSNALRHTSPGGTVWVSVRRGQIQKHAHDFADVGFEKMDCAIVEFADTGSGIPPEYLNEIFSAGFSVSGGTSGLGLAVCSEIVKQHEGSIRVSSTLGLGTTFYVEIPAL
jgi:signal transduction histidine kinase